MYNIVVVCEKYTVCSHHTSLSLRSINTHPRRTSSVIQHKSLSIQVRCDINSFSVVHWSVKTEGACSQNSFTLILRTTFLFSVILWALWIFCYAMNTSSFENPRNVWVVHRVPHQIRPSLGLSSCLHGSSVNLHSRHLVPGLSCGIVLRMLRVSRAGDLHWRFLHTFWLGSGWALGTFVADSPASPALPTPKHGM
jgi:hypothetical protein